MTLHDASYRSLFSHPIMVRSLFDGIIKLESVDSLHWPGMQAITTPYISQDLQLRQGDHVWRIPRHEGSDLYLLLMLEHQSSCDRFMALRMSTYCGLLYENMLRRRVIQGKGLLPVLLPVVLYSGVRRWHAPMQMSLLLDPIPAVLRPYQLQFKYLLIDQGALVLSGTLPEHNLASLLFRLEHNKGIEDVSEIMQTILSCAKGEDHAEVRRAFAGWIRHVLLPRALSQIEFPPAQDFTEIKDMLTEHARSWTHQWKTQGLREGRKEGRAALLRQLLIQKFGPLPEEYAQRLLAASSRQMGVWSGRLLTAATLEDVFRKS
ncbi:Rpn family recombination-promoting nuclease/putative transposase [Allopusillimonas ginsengisoli]|uniref:Rpn family recombination-promoting nuclease/putative transposase n=1 Tax=Allopusillimonas ginsengisoli TaxID=453575 RepID=UPI00101FBFDE|nr:Rpn family recombination-promoting nuclease/putative transposase [Allopusillimonas ginsengisoli]TEA77880.1 hypothetical protein ERE07_12750 [Allopusillimonas ginsengisoli]